MSRIGKKIITVPQNINVTIEKQLVTIQGPKGELSHTLYPSMKIEKKDNLLTITKTDCSQLSQKIYGLSRTIINNMVIGVSEGFTKKLEIEGVGYRAQMDGHNLVLNVGFSHPVVIKSPSEITIEVENNNIINVHGINKEIVGRVAAEIRNVKPPEPYKGKGIRYNKEVIRRKVGKAGK